MIVVDRLISLLSAIPRFCIGLSCIIGSLAIIDRGNVTCIDHFIIFRVGFAIVILLLFFAICCLIFLIFDVGKGVVDLSCRLILLHQVGAIVAETVVKHLRSISQSVLLFSDLVIVLLLVVLLLLLR